MMKRWMIAAIVVAWLGAWAADNSRVVEASYRYVIPENCSQAEAKATAIDRAMAEALAREYGTTVQAETWSDIRNSDERSSTDIWRLGSSTVKGQWLETIGEPQFRFVTDGDNLAVEVKMKGRVAPLSSRQIDIVAVPLKSGRDGVFESQRFLNGERLELRFSSPVSGSLLVFLSDEDGTVTQLLPFPTQKNGAIPIRGGEKYLFFRDNSEDEAEQYALSTDKDLERNILYVIFTPNHIVKPMTSAANGIRFLSVNDFRRWLSERRSMDADLQLLTIPLTILQ